MKEETPTAPEEKKPFDLEHTHIPKNQLPPQLWAKFPNGAVVVFLDYEFHYATPATPAQMDRMLALLDADDYAAYQAYFDQIKGSEALSQRFKTEMDKLRAAEEGIEQTRIFNELAKAARAKDH